MANIKSAKKRVLVAERNHDRNKAIKSSVKTACKKVENAAAQGNKEAACEALKEATKLCYSAASKGVYHKNTVGRKVSRLSKLVNDIQ